jgi:hypothetical protein
MDRRELFKAVAVTGALGATSAFAGAAGARHRATSPKACTDFARRRHSRGQRSSGV